MAMGIAKRGRQISMPHLAHDKLSRDTVSKLTRVEACRRSWASVGKPTALLVRLNARSRLSILSPGLVGLDVGA